MSKDNNQFCVLFSFFRVHFFALFYYSRSNDLLVSALGKLMSFRIALIVFWLLIFSCWTFLLCEWNDSSAAFGAYWRDSVHSSQSWPLSTWFSGNFLIRSLRCEGRLLVACPAGSKGSGENWNSINLLGKGSRIRTFWSLISISFRKICC